MITVNGANFEESMIEENDLPSRYQSWRLSELRDLMSSCCRPQTIDVLELVQWCGIVLHFLYKIIFRNYPSFSVVLFYYNLRKLATEHGRMDDW